MSESSTLVAFVSLISLVAVIIVSRATKVNVGILAFALAWIVGVYVAGISARDVLDGFPLGLMVVLVGVTLLFAEAQANGTLDRVAGFAVGLARGRRAMLPLLMFTLTLVLAALGPGNISAVALIAPMAMSIAGRAGISAFLMTVMVANAANAGAFSPIAPTGIIANGLIARIGLSMNPWTQVFLPSLIAQSAVALGSYLMFGGLRLWRTGGAEPLAAQAAVAAPPALDTSQRLTLVAMAAFVGGVAVLRADAGFLAFALASLLAILRAVDMEQAIKLVPWDVIIMVCGVSTLVALLEKTGGMELLSTLIARVSTPATVTGVLALVTGLASTYSSSSGVVMPAFIPLVPQLVQSLGGGNPAALVASINVGAHLVDVSPLSTLGAICIANAALGEDKERLFRRLLTNGVSMAFIGAFLCFVFFTLLWP